MVSVFGFLIVGCVMVFVFGVFSEILLCCVEGGEGVDGFWGWVRVRRDEEMFC